MDTKEIIINKSKDYLKKLKLSGIDIHLSSFAYLVSWIQCSGYAKLCQLTKKNFFYWQWVFVLNDIFRISNLNNYEILKNEKNHIEFDRLIVSWAKFDDFSTDGSFNDRYLKVNSKELKKTIWLLSYVGNEDPIVVAPNIKIIKSPKRSFIFLLKILLNNLLKYGFSLKFLHYTSWSSIYAIIFQNLFEKEFGKKNFKSIIMPYEGQPFQTNFIKYIKNKYVATKIFGYIHSFPPSLPTHLIFKEYSPDILILNGEDQYKCFNKQLGWSEEKLKLLPSLRFQKNSNEIMDNKIFLPQGINNKKEVLNELNLLLRKSGYEYLNFFKVQKHPTKMNSKRHMGIEKKIEKILALNKKNIKNYNIEKKTSLFIGISSSPIVALERGINVFHICADPNFELFSEKLFPNLKITKLTKNTYLYELRKKGSMILLGDDKISLDEYLL